MSDIFLSYASEDRERVRPLVRALERHGWSVWWDRTIPPGKTFDQVIEEALGVARCVLVVWSQASVASDWVRTEADDGRQRGILVPVLLDAEARIPLAFRRIEAARLVDWQHTSAHPEFERLLQAVTALIGPPASAASERPRGELSIPPQAERLPPRDQAPPSSSLQQQRPPQPVQAEAHEQRPEQPLPPYLHPVWRRLMWTAGIVVGVLIIVLYVMRPTPPAQDVPRPVPEPAAEATSPGTLAPVPLQQTITNSLGMAFVLIPAGEFAMGSANGDTDERPVHPVRIRQAFYLGQYEVTQGEWEAVMGTNPSRFTGDPRRPVEQVSWEDAQQFIQKLNAREGGTRYRLPTEAEWEYAARAGSTTAYSFGDNVAQLGEYAWYDQNAGTTTHPVGQRKPNAWGLYDMHGNVWEWVQDWYGAYAAATAEDPPGPAAGSFRVIRGGSWLFVAGDCRSACRCSAPPGYRYVYLGVRLLRTAR